MTEALGGIPRAVPHPAAWIAPSPIQAEDLAYAARGKRGVIFLSYVALPATEPTTCPTTNPVVCVGGEVGSG